MWSAVCAEQLSHSAPMDKDLDQKGHKGAAFYASHLPYIRSEHELAPVDFAVAAGYVCKIGYAELTFRLG